MKPQYTPAELEAFLDEALPPEMMTAVEESLRTDEDVAARVRETIGRRDAGLHSLGGIWRGERLTCANREQLGNYLLGVLEPEEADYLKFHINEIGCRYCQANLQDLEALQAEAGEAADSRRRKYFQSSVGHLNRSE